MSVNCNVNTSNQSLHLVVDVNQTESNTETQPIHLECKRNKDKKFDDTNTGYTGISDDNRIIIDTNDIGDPALDYNAGNTGNNDDLKNNNDNDDPMMLGDSAKDKKQLFRVRTSYS